MKKILLLLVLLPLAGFCQKSYRVYFDNNSHALSPAGRAVLDSLGKQFADREQGLYIKGYTDTTGTSGYNKVLAGKREEAVKEYLRGQGFTEPMMKSPPEEYVSKNFPKQSNNRMVVIEPVLRCGYRDGYKEAKILGPNGVIVYAAVPIGSGSSTIEIAGFFDAKAMIENEMYALDEGGNVIKTWGMIEITDSGGDIEDGFYTVKFPVGDSEPDPQMGVWLEGENNGRGTRWRSTDIDITKDPTGKYYVVKVPRSRSGRTKINLDRCVSRCGGSGRNGKAVEIPMQVVYLATYTPYDFKNVTIGNPKRQLSFSAKMNDTLWAFTKPVKQNIRNMSFIGYYRENDSVKTVKIRLAKCKYSTDAEGNPVYFVCEKCLKRSTPVKEKGFWAWVRRQFKGK